MVGSVNTNIGAQIALQNLNVTGADLASVQKKISTGLRVSDANDNGAVFAIAQGLRSDISSISSVNGQLGSAKGVLEVAIAAATGIQNLWGDVRNTLIQLADQNVTGNSRTQLNAQYLSLANAINNYMVGANYKWSKSIGKSRDLRRRPNSINAIWDPRTNTIWGAQRPEEYKRHSRYLGKPV